MMHGLEINKVSEDEIKKLKKIFESNPHFQKENVRNACQTSACLYTWVKGMYDCYLILKKVNSKKEALQKEVGEKEEVKTDDLKTEELEKPKIENEEEKKEKPDEKILEKEEKTVEQTLHEVKPILEAALEQINCLDKHDIVEMKSLAKPPIMVGLTMHLVSLLLENNPQKKPIVIFYSEYFNRRLFANQAKLPKVFADGSWQFTNIMKYAKVEKKIIIF